MFKKYAGSLYLNHRFYQPLAAIALLSVLSFFIPVLRPIPALLLLLFCLLLLYDYLKLYSKDAIMATRESPPRLSNGDENEIRILLKNDYPFRIEITVIDELPVQLQARNFTLFEITASNTTNTLVYSIKPLKRGDYIFGNLNIFVSANLKMISRRYQFMEPVSIPVYPTFLQIKSISLQAKTWNSSSSGFKKSRQRGQSMEYEQIQNYVDGNDIRQINWKATARTGSLMVNSFTEERSQQIYCVIDKGRTMKSNINGLSLLDYAINAAMLVTHVALNKSDKAGLITFSDTNGSMLLANSKPRQEMHIAEVLHNEKSRFLESSYDLLFGQIRRRIPQRSLLVLFTNFDSLISLQRQLSYLRRINEYHLLLVIFFTDTELDRISTRQAESVNSLYVKTIAGKFVLEKKQILLELHKYGIMGLMTKPEDLTIQTVNKYLEIKERNLI